MSSGRLAGLHWSLVFYRFSMIVTSIALAIILIVFGYFLYVILRVKKCNKILENCIAEENTLEALNESSLSSIAKTYSDNLVIDTDNGAKTNYLSSDYFNNQSICDNQKINYRLLDTASGTLVGLGLLGTFLGLTIGVAGFDSTNSENIQNSIQGLLSGMSTAFLTSLVGMSLSIAYLSFFDKPIRNKFASFLAQLNDKLDKQYFVDDVTLLQNHQQTMFDALYANLKGVVENEVANVIEKITYTNENGGKSSVGHAIREILSESQEQSKALKSFSTDLALELNNGFDEVLSRQMQQRIVPLMENVDKTTRTIIEHIDKMAATVSSPATDMMEKVVNELKSSMTKVLEEFQSSLSGSATAELETLAKSLNTATTAMGNLPSDMENVSIALQETVEEVKKAINDITTTSADSNTSAMQQMQEQITYATTAISSAIAEVKDVMNGITQSTQKSSNDVVEKLADASEQMGKFLSTSISQITTNLQSSMDQMTSDITSKQGDLLSLQESTTEQTKNLLEVFNTGLERMEKINESINTTMSQFQTTQGQIVGSTAHLQSVTSDMKSATSVFVDKQKQATDKIEALQAASETSIDNITKLVVESSEMSNDYVAQYETIKLGLTTIFEKLQHGLIEYSKTIQASTQDYLDKYTTSLTKTTEALSSTIQQQSEVVEMLADAIQSTNKK